MIEVSDDTACDVRELIRLAQNGDEPAKNRITEQNLGLVRSILKRFQGRAETEDLFQIGCIGLLKAIKRFDFTFDVQFSTYAVPMIIGEIKRFLRDDGIIKVSRSVKETSLKVKIARETLQKELGREPLLHEIADMLRLKVEEIVVALDAAVPPDSLDQAISDNEKSSSLLDMQDDGSDLASDVTNKVALSEIINSLNANEKQIILLRFFRHKTQTEIAQIFGISQVQVSRIEKKILSRIREKMTS